MPRRTIRQERIDTVFDHLETATELVSSDDETTYDQFFEAALEDCLNIYLDPIPPVVKGTDCLVHLLPRYDDFRFKRELRMTKAKFHLIYELIKGCPEFHGLQELQQTPIEIQLALTLYRFGHSGTASSVHSVAKQFGLSDGSAVTRITNRVIKAILTLGPTYIKWPNANERKQISGTMETKFPNCIGVIDGSHIPLEERPLTDSDSYFNRKKQYSIQIQAVVGHNKKILNAFIKFPGSVHDARVFTNSPIGQNLGLYLSPGEWICGDSAYKNTNYMVVPFRKNSTYSTAKGRKRFNRQLSHYRVVVEHVFGILKEIFASLKELRIRVDKKVGHQRACNWIAACCILYNLIYEDITEDEWNSIELDEETEEERLARETDEISIIENEDENEQRKRLYRFFQDYPQV